MHFQSQVPEFQYPNVQMPHGELRLSLSYHDYQYTICTYNKAAATAIANAPAPAPTLAAAPVN
jgi:hypothetical protein